MKFNYKILARIVFRIILFFVFIEMFLRVGGWTSLVLQDKRNQSNLKGVDTYRIICIGDSNTALGGEHSFPRQLDVILNKLDKNRKYEVINKGLPAASSVEILENVQKWVNEYNPNMVVSMMGANDRNDLVKDKRSASLLYNLKVSRLVEGVLLKLLNFKSDKGINQLLLDREISSKPVEKEDKNIKIERESVDPEYVKLLFYGLKLIEAKEYAKAKLIFKYLVSQDTDIVFIDRAYKELGTCLKAQGKIEELISVFKYLFERYEYSVFATDEIRELCKNRESITFIERLLLTLLEAKPDSEHFNGLLGACYAEWGDDAKSEKYISKVRRLRNNSVNISLKKNYLKLADILKKNNIKGVFVQYPMRTIESLEIMLQGLNDSYDFVLVENKDNFKEALKPDKYKEYFTDRNYNDLGHCTPKGNYILAENTAKVILKRLK